MEPNSDHVLVFLEGCIILELAFLSSFSSWHGTKNVNSRRRVEAAFIVCQFKEQVVFKRAEGDSSDFG